MALTFSRATMGSDPEAYYRKTRPGATPAATPRAYDSDPEAYYRKTRLGSTAAPTLGLPRRKPPRSLFDIGLDETPESAGGLTRPLFGGEYPIPDLNGPQLHPKAYYQQYPEERNPQAITIPGTSIPMRSNWPLKPNPSPLLGITPQSIPDNSNYSQGLQEAQRAYVSNPANDTGQRVRSQLAQLGLSVPGSISAVERERERAANDAAIADIKARDALPQGYGVLGSRLSGLAQASEDRAQAAATLAANQQQGYANLREVDRAHPFGTEYEQAGTGNTGKPWQAWQDWKQKTFAQRDTINEGGMPEYVAPWKGPSGLPVVPSTTDRLRAALAGYTASQPGAAPGIPGAVPTPGAPVPTNSASLLEAMGITDPQAMANHMAFRPGMPGGTLAAEGYASPAARRMMVTARARGEPMTEPLARLLSGQEFSPTQLAGGFGPEVGGLHKDIVKQRLMTQVIGTVLQNPGPGGVTPKGLRDTLDAVDKFAGGAYDPSALPDVPLPTVNPTTGKPDLEDVIDTAYTMYPKAATDKTDRAKAMAFITSQGYGKTHLESFRRERDWSRSPVFGWLKGRISSPGMLAERRARYGRVAGLLGVSPDPGY